MEGRDGLTRGFLPAVGSLVQADNCSYTFVRSAIAAAVTQRREICSPYETATYSYRNVTIGSTLVARRAGKTQAVTPTPNTAVTTRPRVKGSVAETPRNWLARSRVSARLATNPMAMPVRIRVSPRFSINRKMLEREAPSASRIPTSWVLSDTM